MRLPGDRPHVKPIVMKFALVLLLATASFPFHARAEAPAETVRGYFAALEHHDFTRALALTSGEAMKRTARMLGALHREAAQHHAEVELKVQQLQIAERASGGTAQVDVTFDIDVIGKRWFFRKVARKLTGTAHFYVATAAVPRIVAIEGQLY